LARKVYKKKTTKRHYRDNIEYRDILTHDNRHQLFLISPVPSHDVDCSVVPWSMVEIISALTLLTCGFQECPLVPLYTHQTSQVCNCMSRVFNPQNYCKEQTLGWKGLGTRLCFSFERNYFTLVCYCLPL